MDNKLILEEPNEVLGFLALDDADLERHACIKLHGVIKLLCEGRGGAFAENRTVLALPEVDDVAVLVLPHKLVENDIRLTRIEVTKVLWGDRDALELLDDEYGDFVAGCVGCGGVHHLCKALVLRHHQ